MVTLTKVDRPIVDEIVGPQRIPLMEEVGMAMANPEMMSVDVLLAAVEVGACEAWVGFLGERPVGFSMYAPTSMRGVWSGEVINAEGVGDLRGVGTAVMARALDMIFGDRAARRVFGFVSAANPAANRLVESLGYTQEGCARRLLHRSDGTEVDAYLYRLHRDEWLGSAAWYAQTHSAAGAAVGGGS